MARVGTTKFNLGQHEQGDNPGGGSQDETTYASNTGLNGNWAKIEKALSQHKTDGTHEDDVIDGRNIKASMADGSSIEASTGTGVKSFRVKALGIVTAMLADISVTLSKLAASSVDNSKLVSTAGSEAVNTNVMRDNCITLPKIPANILTAAKEAHDNNSRKVVFAFVLKSIATSTFGWYGDQQLTANFGIGMPQAGFITKMVVKDSTGVGPIVYANYATSGGTHFNQGDRIGVMVDASTLIAPTINGVTQSGTMFIGAAGRTLNIFVTLEIEFDD